MFNNDSIIPLHNFKLYLRVYCTCFLCECICKHIYYALYNKIQFITFPIFQFMLNVWKLYLLIFCSFHRYKCKQSLSEAVKHGSCLAAHSVMSFLEALMCPTLMREKGKGDTSQGLGRGQFESLGEVEVV